MDLSFGNLRDANWKLRHYKNAKDQDWKLSDWAISTLGELGEAANIIEKIERGDVTLDAARPALAKEFADVAIYLDLLATRTGVNLAEAIIEEFNNVSRCVGSPIRLSGEGVIFEHSETDL